MGGAIYLDQCGNLDNKIEDKTNITINQADLFGGGIYFYNSTILSLYNTPIINNRALIRGGVFFDNYIP